MDTRNSEKRFICVEYPGIVKNDEDMIQTLGGIKKISKVFELEKRRMELNYRPNDIFSKPTIGDKYATTGIILKIRRKKNSKDEKYILTEIVGHVNTVFRFESLCDFQYLAMSKDDKNNPKFIYKDIVPDKVINLKWLNDMDVPYFLPPVTFARIDSIQEGLFKKDLFPKSEVENERFIERSRVRRDKHTSIMTFDLTSPIPNNPHTETFQYLKTKLVSLDLYNRVKALFDKRPIWSRLALTYESKICREQLKFILPALAFYFSNGPWRITWVRFGYDPRKQFESRYYQTFDYRVRNIIGVKDLVKIKRSYLKNKPNLCQKTKKLDITQYNEPNIPENSIIFSPYYEFGQIPQTRQTIYQYCDIRVPQIQEMLDKIPTPISGAVCDEKTGWLPSGFDEMCRFIITDGIRECQKNNSLKLDDEENNEEELIYDDILSDEEDILDETIEE